MNYLDFKNSVLGKIIGDGQCVSLVINNSKAYVEALFPGVSWPTIMAPVASAKQLANKGNAFLQWVANNHNDPNQLPPQGAIMIFDATPQVGYENVFPNPDGHDGICDSADSKGYVLLQQNAPAFGQAVNLTRYDWKFRPCLGWYIPTGQMPTPQPVPTEHTIFLPPTTGPWHLYNDDGPYVPSAVKVVNGKPAMIVPSEFGGITYTIVQDKGNGIYIVNTQMFGQGALWTKGSDVVIK